MNIDDFHLFMTTYLTNEKILEIAKIIQFQSPQHVLMWCAFLPLCASTSQTFTMHACLLTRWTYNEVAWQAQSNDKKWKLNYHDLIFTRWSTLHNSTETSSAGATLLSHHEFIWGSNLMSFEHTLSAWKWAFNRRLDKRPVKTYFWVSRDKCVKQ